VSEKVDVYSYGVMLAELLSGERQWVKLSVAQIMKLCLVQQKHPPVPATVPPAIAQLCEDCMAFDAADRPSFVQVCARLQQLALALVRADPWRMPKAMAQGLAWQTVNSVLRTVDVPLSSAQPEVQALLQQCAGLTVTRIVAIDNKTLADRFTAQYALLQQRAKATGFKATVFAQASKQRRAKELSRVLCDLPGAPHSLALST
jgi:hypothetical protein